MKQKVDDEALLGMSLFTLLLAVIYCLIETGVLQ